MESIKADICMLLNNPMTHDSRVIREASTLAKAGYKVVVLCHYLDKGKDKLPKVEEINGFVVYRFPAQWKPLMYFFVRQIAQFMGFRLYNLILKPLKIFDRLAKLWFLHTMYKLTPPISLMINQLEYIDAKVIHAHDFPNLLIAYYGTSDGQKIVYDSHEIFFDQNVPKSAYEVAMNETGRYYEKEFVTRCSGFITVGEKVAEHLAQTLEIPRPTVIRNTVDLRTLEADAAFAYPALGKRRIVHTGGITEGRHLHELVKSVAYLAEDIILILMGSGSLEYELTELAKKIGVSHRFFIVPPVRPNQIVATAAQADIAVVLTSRFGGYNQEYSLPNKLFEAIAAGLPVVSGPNVEIAGVVTGHEIGIVCDPQYPEQIAEAIQEILNEENYSQFERNAKQAQQVLNWEEEEKILLKFYDDFLADTR